MLDDTQIYCWGKPMAQKVEHWHSWTKEEETIIFPRSKPGTETVAVTCQGHSRIEQQRLEQKFLFLWVTALCLSHKTILHLSLFSQGKNMSFLFAYLVAVLATGNRVLLSEQSTSKGGVWSNRGRRGLSSCLPVSHGGMWHSWCALERLPESYCTLKFHVSWSWWRQGELAARPPSD